MSISEMKKGYRSAGELLVRDRDLEEELATRLEELSTEQTNPELEELLRDIARRCRNNGNKINRMIEELSSPDYRIALKCPVCGWAIPLGTDPEPGTEVQCKQCRIWFKLIEKEGDYLLEKTIRPDARS
jgi:hypothetical protein